MKNEFVNRLKDLRFLTICIILLPFVLNLISTELLSSICEYAMNGDGSQVFSHAIFLIFIYVLMMLVPGIVEYIYNNRRIIATHNLRCFVYEIIIKRSRDDMLEYTAGSIKESLTDDLSNVIEKYASLYARIACIALVYIGYTVYLFINNPIIAAAMVSLSMIQLIPPFVVKKFLQKSYDNTREIEGEMTDCILEGIYGIDAIKSFGLYDWWSESIERLNKKYKKIGKMSIYTTEMEKSMNTFVQNLLKYGLYIVLGLFVLYKWISMPEAVKAIAVSGAFFPLVGDVSAGMSGIIMSNKAEKRLFSIDAAADHTEMEIKEKTIELRNVMLQREGYTLIDTRGENINLDGINVICGENGAGKTTLLNAIIGSFKDYNGEIIVGGIDSKGLSNDNFPRKIAFLSQEDIPLDITVGELIDEELKNTKEANIMENISERFGLDLKKIECKLLRELSGGERKKVFLSIIFSICSPIIILDEPTNSLDKEGKETLLKIIKASNSTIVIVTHERGDYLNVGNIIEITCGGLKVG